MLTNSLRKLLFPAYRAVVRLFRGSRIGELRWIGRAHRFLMSRLGPRSVLVAGFAIEVDSIDSLGLAIGEDFERFERELLARHLHAGDVMIDVGANIGLHTLVGARAVGPEGRIIAFEPDPENFRLLGRNVERNGMRNVVAHQIAVGNRSGTLRLFRSDDNRGDHRIYDPHDGRASITVEVVRLDDFLDESRLESTARVAAIKMDIQGAELEAARGMMDLLGRSSGAILFTELWPAGLVAAGGGAREYLDFLSRFGFLFHEIQERHNRIVAVTVDEVLSKLPPGPAAHTNLLCARERLVP